MGPWVPKNLRHGRRLGNFLPTFIQICPSIKTNVRRNSLSLNSFILNPLTKTNSLKMQITSKKIAEFHVFWNSPYFKFKIKLMHPKLCCCYFIFINLYIDVLVLVYPYSTRVRNRFCGFPNRFLDEIMATAVGMGIIELIPNNEPIYIDPVRLDAWLLPTP